NRRSAGLPESGGHSGMHNYVGGDMADLNRAARDPCFYSHHANVDRMMELWKRNIRGSNSSWRAESGPWLNTTFTFRFDNKRVYAYRVRDLLDTETVADADGVRLAYTYDNIGAPGAVASSVPAPSVLSLDGAVVQAGGLSFEPPKQIISLGPLRVTPETSRTSAVTLSTPAQGALKEFLNRDRSKELQNFTADTAAGGGARIGASVVLRLEKIQIPPHNFQINFFLNEKNPSISDIDTSNNYIASFNHVPSHANTIELDVLEVDVSERLRDRIAELGSVQISTVTEYLPPGSAPVVIGNISFVIR
ncbi:MAG: tyrosinase family protein, partial [Pseudorhodoplanes sp.]